VCRLHSATEAASTAVACEYWHAAVAPASAAAKKQSADADAADAADDDECPICKNRLAASCITCETENANLEPATAAAFPCPLVVCGCGSGDDGKFALASRFASPHGHRYHLDCISRWLRVSSTCPSGASEWRWVVAASAVAAPTSASGTSAAVAPPETKSERINEETKSPASEAALRVSSVTITVWQRGFDDDVDDARDLAITVATEVRVRHGFFCRRRQSNPCVCVRACVLC
jgi:hypothetical protein